MPKVLPFGLPGRYAVYDADSQAFLAVTFETFEEAQVCITQHLDISLDHEITRCDSPRFLQLLRVS